MKVRTDSERVRLSRKLVMELLASSVDLSTTPVAPGYLERYDAAPERFGPPAPPSADRDRRPDGPPRRAGRAHRGDRLPAGEARQRALRPRLREVHPLLQVRRRLRRAVPEHVRDPVAGRGFDARISTELDTPLPESACVYCGNCIAVCPTGALMFRSEYELREAGDWREDEQAVTETICPYCGVGCALELHVQDNTIVKVTSPDDHDVTRGQPLHQGPVRLPARPRSRRVGADVALCPT